MVKRPFWQKRIEEAWQKRNLIWLSGARRAGKTFLTQSLPHVEYFDCELPSTRQQMEDPETFWKGLRGRRVIVDEIHRLGNPSELLKIAADHFPETRVLATGSSTLGASRKFRDTLTGRKTELWLTPMIADDLKSFQNTDIEHRFHRGGLPPFFLSKEIPEREFQEWMDAFWAKDIQELFQLERRYSFQKFVELLLIQSGGIFEATRFAGPCEVSRSAISNYLKVLEATFVIHMIRPFSTHKPTEIIAAPKVYGFDTGFVCYYRGWNRLRREDMGTLWEHFVLNELHGQLQTRDIGYWRDKQGHEIDFILPHRGAPPIAIECKWRSADFDPANLQIFLRKYPSARSFVVASDVSRNYSRRFAKAEVQFVNLDYLLSQIKAV